MDDRAMRRRRIFFPYMAAAVEQMQINGARFAYYTSADVATSILRGRRVWMRNTRTMNDYMEVQHGLECLVSAFHGEPGKALKAVLDRVDPDITDEIWRRFSVWAPGIPHITYVTCLTEHPADEDKLGRLSMWRAYGGKAGIALVMKSDALIRDVEVGVYSSPVSYLDSAAFAANMQQVASLIDADLDFVKELGVEDVKNAVFHMFWFGAICTKHPGFVEEKEWRIVASPMMYKAPILEENIEVVRGVPQSVYKLPLRDRADLGIEGLEIASLLDHVIIGPCDHPNVIFNAMVSLLGESGIQEPYKRVTTSNIPLRHA